MQIQVAALILQSISSAAIAGGFIFAAIQVRESRKTAHVANFSKLVELQLQLRRMRVEDPSLAYVFQDDVANLKGDQEIRAYFMNLMQLSLFEIAWYSHQKGQLADDYWESWVKRMKSLRSEESFQRAMANPSMKIMHDEFYEYLRRLVGGEPAAPGAGRA